MQSRRAGSPRGLSLPRDPVRPFKSDISNSQSPFASLPARPRPEPRHSCRADHPNPKSRRAGSAGWCGVAVHPRRNRRAGTTRFSRPGKRFLPVREVAEGHAVVRVEVEHLSVGDGGIWWGGLRRRLVAQKRPEPSLGEMLVIGERIGHFRGAHDLKRDTIGQRPGLVEACSVQSQAALKRFRRGRDDRFLSARRAHEGCQGLQVPGGRTLSSLLLFPPRLVQLPP